MLRLARVTDGAVRPELRVRVAWATGRTPLFGRTTTLVPTLTRLKRSLTSSLVSRMQPLDTCWPMVLGALVPWMRYSVLPRYMARAPSGLPGPPAMKRGRYGCRSIISGGGCESGPPALG